MKLGPCPVLSEESSGDGNDEDDDNDDGDDDDDDDNDGDDGVMMGAQQRELWVP